MPLAGLVYFSWYLVVSQGYLLYMKPKEKQKKTAVLYTACSQSGAQAGWGAGSGTNQDYMALPLYSPLQIWPHV